MRAYRNHEHYSDPTAGAAVGRMMREQGRERRWRLPVTCRRKVYVASKYAGDTEENVRLAVGYCRYVIEEGYIPIASHLLYPQMLDDSNPHERELGLMFGLALLAICEEVWVFGEVSEGMAREIEEATRLHKTVKFIKGAWA